MSYCRRSKYKAVKVVVDGIKFDSKKEAKRYEQLKEREKKGEIKDLRLQVLYELIPSQREEDYVDEKGKLKKGKVIERPCVYKADFVYYDNEKQEEIVEDTKGFKTPEYIIKRKLMLYLLGIKITEI